MILPNAIKEFLNKATVPGDMCLPYHYPAPEHFETFQSCYRYDGNTLADLTSTAPGGFHPNWYIITYNYFSDPYFIDITEEAQGFPVYYAPSSAGKWVPTKVATSLANFSKLLTNLAALLNDTPAYLKYLETHVDTTTAPWSEIYSNAAEPAEV